MKQSRGNASFLKSVVPTMRILAAAVIAIAALFVTGLVTKAEAQSGSTIVVRARGTAGGESITLRVDNSNVATWTLATSFQTFSASTNLTGAATVAFTNDATGRDVQVDYIIVNGETRQSENQSSNSGLYANGSCGGGSNSEWMHCNGAIGYGPVSNSANSIVVRARGTAGSESISLRVDNTNVATWTLTTSYQDYSASTNLTGAITMAFTNDATGRDVQVDYIVVNGQARQAEAQSYNTAFYANGSCGGGGFSEWMHCNGVIGFGNVSGGGGGGPFPRFSWATSRPTATSDPISSSTGIRSRRRTRASGARSKRRGTCTTGAAWTGRTTTRWRTTSHSSSTPSFGVISRRAGSTR